MSLSQEQLKMIEEKRQNALKIKAAKTSNSPDKLNIKESASKGVQNFSRVYNQPVKCFSRSVSQPTPTVHKEAPFKTKDNPTSTPLKVSHKYSQASAQKPSSTVATCQLISPTRFDIDVKYNEKVIQSFKSIKSSLYDANQKKWSFHISDYSEVTKRMQQFSGEVIFNGLPKYILQAFEKPTPDPVVPDEEMLKIDSSLMSQVMPFQKEGIRFGISKAGRCILADDMGLGKTIQALGIAHYYRKDWPMLIVCPSSMRYEWVNSIERWLSSVQPFTIKVLNSGKDTPGDAKILITSYDLLARHIKIVSQKTFGVVIMDESHFLKNIKSARTKAALEFCKKAKRVLLLSGTPALSRPSELYTQIRAVSPKTFVNFHDYGLRYCDAKKNAWCWDYSGSSNSLELQLLLESKFMIRRLKSEVVEQLPSKFREVVILNPSDVNGNTDDMKNCVKSLSKLGLKGLDWRGALLTYFGKTGAAKLPAVKKYLSDLLECGKKVICFAHHQCVIDGICDLLEDNDLRYIRIDGSVSSEKRKQFCDSFQYDEDVMAAVLSLTAANSGITLTAAHMVIFAELFWNPGVLTQAEDRAHRLGQKDSVMVRYLVARGTADDYLWPLIQSKLNVLNKVGLSKDNFSDTQTTEMHVGTHQVNIRDYFVELSASDDTLTSSQEQFNMEELLVDEEDELAQLDLDFLVENECKKQRLEEAPTS